MHLAIWKGDGAICVIVWKHQKKTCQPLYHCVVLCTIFVRIRGKKPYCWGWSRYLLSGKNSRCLIVNGNTRGNIVRDAYCSYFESHPWKCVTVQSAISPWRWNLGSLCALLMGDASAVLFKYFLKALYIILTLFKSVWLSCSNES